MTGDASVHSKQLLRLTLLFTHRNTTRMKAKGSNRLRGTPKFCILVMPSAAYLNMVVALCVLFFKRTDATSNHFISASFQFCLTSTLEEPNHFYPNHRGRRRKGYPLSFARGMLYPVCRMLTSVRVFFQYSGLSPKSIASGMLCKTSSPNLLSFSNQLSCEAWDRTGAKSS